MVKIKNLFFLLVLVISFNALATQPRWAQFRAQYPSLEDDILPQNIPPLHHAVCEGWPHIVEQLLLAGADPNRLDRHNFSPLSYAVANRRFALILTLLEAGAKGSQLTIRNPLILAAHHGDPHILRELLANVNFLKSLPRNFAALIPEARWRGLEIDSAFLNKVIVDAICDAVEQSTLSERRAQRLCRRIFYLRPAGYLPPLLRAPVSLETAPFREELVMGYPPVLGLPAEEVFEQMQPRPPQGARPEGLPAPHAARRLVPRFSGL